MARGSFGERLKRERELREVTCEEVAAATRISARFLQALENEDWDKLPGGIFGRGFVRSIARYLGLDEENLLAEYDLARGDQLSQGLPRPEERVSSPPKWIPVLLALLVIVVLAGMVTGGIYAWRWYLGLRAAKHASSRTGQDEHPRKAAGGDVYANVPDSVTSGTAGVSTAAAAPLDLSVSASATVRVRIVGDGKLLFDAEFPGGQTSHFAAQNEFEISASDSSDVLLELNGQTMPPLGEPGASGTMVLSRKDVKQTGGNAQP